LLVGDFDFMNLIRQGFSMKGCDTGSNFASDFSSRFMPIVVPGILPEHDTLR
jgi:hypothetical protein